jgi:hypothetical protein
MKYLYTQCTIKHDTGSQEVAWIPTEFAKLNQKIILGKKATVIEIGSRTTRDMAKYAEDYKKAHLRTDIPRKRKTESPQ